MTGFLLGQIISILFFGFVAFIATRSAIKRLGINPKYGWTGFITMAIIFDTFSFIGALQYAKYASKPLNFSNISIVSGFFIAGILLWLSSFAISFFRKDKKKDA